MSEFHLSQSRPYQPQQPNVEWYSAGSSQYGPSSYGSAYGPASNTGGGAYGSFEDEPPLLEGAVAWNDRAAWR